MGRMNVVIVFLLGACAGSAATAVSPGPLAAMRPGEPAVIPLEDAPVRIAPSGHARVFILAQGNNAFLGKLEMDPGAQVPKHRDATEEYVHVLEGSGSILIDGKPYDVTPGATIYMPPDAEVSFQNGPAKMVGIQVWAGPAPAQKYDAWKPVE